MNVESENRLDRFSVLHHDVDGAGVKAEINVRLVSDDFLDGGRPIMVEAAIGFVVKLLDNAGFAWVKRFARLIPSGWNVDLGRSVPSQNGAVLNQHDGAAMSSSRDGRRTSGQTAADHYNVMRFCFFDMPVRIEIPSALGFQNIDIVSRLEILIRRKDDGVTPAPPTGQVVQADLHISFL